MEQFKHLRIRFESLKRVTKNFSDDNFIAEGGFGKVYRGEFRDSEGLTIGAVKCLDRSKDQADTSFWREIMMLSSYRHENIVSLIGFCDEGEERIIVYEYASNKSLDFHLHKPNLTWLQRLNICVGAARGLEYLHDPKGSQQRVLHRDIKSANILLDEHWNAKIVDFGLSKYGPANQQNTFLFSDAKGTLGYCDPMYIDTMLLTKESDVYSFGVVLFEVLCSRHCVDLSYEDVRRSLPMLVKNCYEEKTLDMIIDIKLKQQMEQKSFDTFVTLAYQCIERNRAQRPPMAMVVRRLENALKHQEVFEVKAQEEKRRNRVLRSIGDVLDQEGEAKAKADLESSLRSLKLKEHYNPLLDYEKICPPGGSDVLILYTTGVKTIRKTKEDCSSVGSLLKGFGVLYEERDVSMHWSFKDELWRIFGRQVALPRLFIKGRYIGGAEEVLLLHEQGKLQPLVAGIPPNISEGPCKVCARNLFVVCRFCSGSNKVDSGGRGLPKSCMKCNENGLVKCPICF